VQVWLRALLVLASIAARYDAHARPAIIAQQNVPAFVAVASGARAALPDATVLDLASLSAEEARQRLRAERPQVIVAVGPRALQLAVHASQTTPIVFVMVAEPRAIVGPPEGRQLEGVGLHVPPEALLAQLKRLRPQAHALWTVYSRAETGAIVERLRTAAQNRGLSITAAEANDSAEALRHLLSPPQHADACLMLPDRVVRNAAADQALLQLAFARHLPVVGVSAADVRAGALFALQLDARALGAQAGELAHQITARPAPPKMEVVPPTGYRLVLNVATAQHLGISVPPEVLHSAEVLGR
jgi:putative ABC transport system substrate-binding protein